MRQVHFGPGAFFRAHTAWYAAHADPDWGVAAVAPRSPAAIDQLGPQDGLYTLMVRGPDGDRLEVVPSVSGVQVAADGGWRDLLTRPEVAVVTLTVTEAGYQPGAPVLRLLADALLRRVEAGGPPLSVMSCDNISANGPLLARLLGEAAPPAVRDWIDAGGCAFPSSVVDRITPAATPADRADVQAELGLEDRAATVTEPWTEWVVEDRFPAGRPDWPAAGALVVSDVTPYSQRKLRLLNGGHSLLAYVGGARGYLYVHEAAADEALQSEVRALWDEALEWMDPASRPGLDDWLAQVRVRWANSRLPHRLEQIATDGSTKLAERVVPTIRAAVERGASAPVAESLFAAWIAHLRGATPFAVHDARIAELGPVMNGSPAVAARTALEVLGLDDLPAVAREVAALVRAQASR